MARNRGRLVPPFDKRGLVRLKLAVNYTEARRHYLELLARDRTTPAPRLRLATVRELHEWKSEMRAYDAAQIELKLATPREVQERNAAVRVRQSGGRIVRHAVHA